MPTTAVQHGEMPYRTLGRTQEPVSAIGLGGWHLGFKDLDDQLAIRIIRAAIDCGINFLDNSWDYNEGVSEIRMGRALRDGYRHKAFLMTKIDGRSSAEAMRQLHDSLRRLETDHIDLVQHHEILRFEDPHRIFDDEGAHRVLIDAQKAGKGRYIGFTGHKDPRIHLHMLDVADEHGIQFGVDSLARLDQAFEAARTFRPMSAAQREALLAKTATAASRGQYELFKTTSIFDATATNPDWLGEEPQRIQRAMPQ